MSQKKYINDLLVKTKMHEAKGYTTSMLARKQFSVDDGNPFQQPEQYRSVVGAL